MVLAVLVVEGLVMRAQSNQRRFCGVVLAILAAMLSSVVAAVPVAAAPTSDISPVSQQLASQASAAVDVAVFAQGGTGAERLELHIDGRTVARFTMSTSLREYNFSTTQAIGSRSLSLHFVNDASVAGDRYVTIDRVHVNDVQFQTEASSVELLGAWTNGSCKQAGNHELESLTCNGYAKYVIGNAGQPRAAAAAAPRHPKTAFPKAGNNGRQGCISPCRTVGFQDFDGQKNAVLENVIITNPGGPCLSLEQAENITIRNVTLRNCANNPTGEIEQEKIIRIVDSKNIIIVGSLLIENASISTSNNDLIHIHNSTGVKIYNNEIRNVRSNASTGRDDGGNRAILVTGNTTANLIIDRNDFFSPGRNAVQVSRARRVEGIRITRNRIEGRRAWDSDFEDMINFFSTTGTPASPIVVRGNYMRNGGPSDSGTAIILGDGRDNLGTGYITVVKNVIVDPGHVGINVAGGHNFVVKNNIIYGGANVGEWTATGLTINHYRYTPACRDHAIYGNRVFFKNQFPQHNGTNHLWNPGTCTNNVRIHSNSFGDRTLSYKVWDIG